MVILFFSLRLINMNMTKIKKINEKAFSFNSILNNFLNYVKYPL